MTTGDICITDKPKSKTRLNLELNPVPIQEKKEMLVFMDFETNGVHRACIPIEIALLFVELNGMKIKSFYNSLIYTQDMKETVYDNKKLVDLKTWNDAEQIHHLSMSHVVKYGQIIGNVASDIWKLTERYMHDYTMRLISDNPVFDCRQLDKVLQSVGMDYEKSFHYNPLSTRTLDVLTGTDKPNKPHRAAEDVCIMYERLKRFGIYNLDELQKVFHNV